MPAKASVIVRGCLTDVRASGADGSAVIEDEARLCEADGSGPYRKERAPFAEVIMSRCTIRERDSGALADGSSCFSRDYI